MPIRACISTCISVQLIMLLILLTVQCSHSKSGVHTVFAHQRPKRSARSSPGGSSGLRSGLDSGDLRSESGKSTEGRGNQDQKSLKRVILVVKKVRTVQKRVFTHCSHTVRTLFAHSV